MHLLRVLHLCAIIIFSICVSADHTVNRFVDHALEATAALVRTNALEPRRMAAFEVKLDRDSLFGSEFEAVFRKVLVNYLSQNRRADDCVKVNIGRLIRISCRVSLQFVNVLMDADVIGDSTDLWKHSISTLSIVEPSAVFLLDVRGVRRYKPRIVQIEVENFTTSFKVKQGKLRLSKDQYEEFKKQVDRQLFKQLKATLQGPYLKVLRKVIQAMRLP